MNSLLKLRRRIVRSLVRRLDLWQDLPLEEVARNQQRFAYSPRVAWLHDRSWMTPYLPYLKNDRHPASQADETRILDRRYTLACAVKTVANLPGSTAECGVFKGVGSGIICETLRTHWRPGETHFAFDSFEGLPEPTPDDGGPQQQAYWKAGDLKVPEEIARQLLSPFPVCQIVKGWIPESLAVAANHRFRFVHVDVDLAQPTLDVLEFFYDRMVPGGIILFDDYGFISCPGAKAAADRFFAERPEHLLEVTAGQALVVKLDPRVAKAA